MARPSPSEIPQEIVDEVIDLCSKDERTLITCSLISRAWVYRARKYLFSTLALTDKNLPTWHNVVVTLPKPNKGSRKQQLPPTSCPPSPSCAPLSSYVTSLKLAPTYSQAMSGDFESALLRASTHFSAFINLYSLTLSAISFVAFWGPQLKACFGSFGETVRELRLLMCSLDWKVLSFLKLFTRLELLKLDGNAWTNTRLLKWASVLQEGPVLRNILIVSNFTDANIELFDYLSTTRVEYRTISLGYNTASTFSPLNTLFAKCKDHLLALILTAADSTTPADEGLVLDLSPCERLIEINARLNFAKFALIIATLRTVSSPRFRNLILFIPPPIPNIKLVDWVKLDEEVSALAKRVGATTENDKLKVVIRSYSTTLGGTQLSEIGEALPLSSQNIHVSLRTEYHPLPAVC